MNYMDHSCLFSDHQKTLSHEIQKFVYIVPSYPLIFENRFAPPTANPPTKKKKNQLLLIRRTKCPQAKRIQEFLLDAYYSSHAFN